MHDGSITFSTALDNADLEKELGRLKKKILRQMEDIGRTEFKRNDLEEQLKAAKENLELLNQIKAPVDADIARLNELYSRIPKLEAEIRRCNEAVRDGNAALAYTKARYGEILEEAGRIRPAEGGTGLEKLSKEAAGVNKRLHELAERYADLSEKNDDFDPNEGEFLTLRQEIKDCVLYLDELAESGQLEKLASGAEIAEDRIADLKNTIGEYEYRLENFDLTEDQQDTLSAKVEKGKRLLDAYQKSIDKASASAEDNRIQAISEDAEIANQHIVDLNRELAELRQRQKELEGAGIGLGHAEYDQNTTRIAEITRELKEYQKTLSNTSDSGAGKIEPPISRAALAAQKMNAVLAKSKDLLKSVGTVGANALKAAGKGIAEAAKKAASFAAGLNAFSKLTGSMSGKLKRLGQMIKRVFVFSVITSGLRAIRTQMSGYLKVNTEFMTALRRLQGVLLTAFQPIYEIAVPALTTLINVLSRAAATVTQFFASLFGTTAKQAQINAKDLYEQANATTAAGNAAEEASKQLAGFDEINKLSESSSAGGGGSVSVDTGPLFDYEYDETPFDSWGEAFSAFLDKLLAGIPKLRDTFKNFADWLNDCSKKLYDMFTFPGVLEKVKQLGRDLAGALNDLVSWIDWYQLGQALGAGLNLALNFLTSFIYKFDWINLGRKLAEFVNGLVSEIDWYEFGRLLWAGFKIGLETLAGFLLGLDMALLAEAASNIVIGFFTEMKNTIDKIPWGEIGRQIVRFLVNIKWSEIFQVVYDAFHSALDALANFITGFLDEIGEQLDMRGITDPLIELVQTVHDFIQTIVEDTINWVKSLDLTPLSQAFQNLLEAISHLVSAISNGLLWAYENVLLPLAAWVIEEAAPASVNVLAQAFETAAAVISVTIEVIKTLFEAMKPVFEWIGNAAIKIIEGLGGIFEKVSQTFQEQGPRIQAIVSEISGAVSAMWAVVEPILTLLMELVGVVFTFWEETVSSKINGILDIMEGLIDFIAGVFSGDWERAWSGILEAFLAPVKTILDWIDNLVSAVKSAAKAVTGFFSEAGSSRSSSFGSASSGSFGGSARIAVQSMPDMANFTIPKLAQGAVIPPNREFMAVLGDQKSGTNVEAPLATIEQAVANVMSRMGASSRSQTVVLEVNGRELGRAVVEFGDAEYQRIGVRLTEARA